MITTLSRDPLRSPVGSSFPSCLSTHIGFSEVYPLLEPESFIFFLKGLSPRALNFALGRWQLWPDFLSNRQFSSDIFLAFFCSVFARHFHPPMGTNRQNFSDCFAILRQKIIFRFSYIIPLRSRSVKTPGRNFALPCAHCDFIGRRSAISVRGGQGSALSRERSDPTSGFWP